HRKHMLCRYPQQLRIELHVTAKIAAASQPAPRSAICRAASLQLHLFPVACRSSGRAEPSIPNARRLHRIACVVA
ncbi:hypothetical protein VDS11_20540, partial [Xanthomonas campestris pv. campestris]|nr:hypothetical protein [Xanthomonas campestris pv. campestris]